MALFDKRQVLERLREQRHKYVAEFSAADLKFRDEWAVWKREAPAAFRRFVAAAEPHGTKFGDIDAFRPPTSPSLNGSAKSIERLIREVDMMTPNSKGAINLTGSNEVSRWL